MNTNRRLVITTTVPETMSAFVVPQLKPLVEAGWEVHLVTSPGHWPIQPDTVAAKRHEIAMSRSISPLADSAALTSWIRMLRVVRPQVVLGGTPKAALLAMTSARITAVPRRIYLHRGARWETTSGLKRSLLVRADRLTAAEATDVIAVSNSLADLVVAQRIVRRRPIVLGSGASKGIDLTRFRPIDNRTESNMPPTLGFVGRLSADKGLESAFGVFDLVRDELPNARLLVAGEIDRPNPVPDRLLERLRTDPAVSWNGFAANMPAFFHQLDVLLFPSLREGMPNVVLEAAACGVPAVGWNVTGVKDAIAQERTGELVPVGNTSAFADAVIRVLRNPRGSYGSACSDWAKQFDQERVTRLLVDWLDANGGTAPSLVDSRVG